MPYLTIEAEDALARMRAAGLSVKPIKDRILVLQRAPKRESESGLIAFPDAVADDSKEGGRGEVLAVGPVVVDVRPGDRIIFRRRGGTALIPDPREGGANAWKNVLVLREAHERNGRPESDVIAVVEDSP